MVKMKKHPTLGIMVRSDGLVLCPPNRLTNEETWKAGGKMSHGYRRVCIKCKTYYIHRLVAETFIPNPENKPAIDHIDRNRDNNDVSNLRWVTIKENAYNQKNNIPGVRRCDLTKKEYDKIINERSRTKKKLQEAK